MMSEVSSHLLPMTPQLAVGFAVIHDASWELAEATPAAASVCTSSVELDAAQRLPGRSGQP